MHLALFAPSWPPGGSANGIVTYVSEVRNLMKSVGFRVTVVSHETVHHDDGRITKLENKYPKLLHKFESFPGIYRLINFLIGKRIANSILVHCPEIDLFEMEESFGWIGVVQDHVKIPVVLRLHGPEFLGQVDTLEPAEKAKSQKKADNEGLAIRDANYVSAPSAQILHSSTSKYNNHSSIVRSYPNPMAPDEGAPWQLKNCKRYKILHVGRFDRRKGADIIIEAFCNIASEFPQAELVMVGPEVGIVDSDGSCLNVRQYLDRNVSQAFQQRIHFLGKIPTEEVQRLRRESHICVVPSRFEVLPYSALETLAAGAPLIVADGFADNALVIDGKTGWMARNGCPRDFASKLRMAFEIGEGIEEIGQGGKEFFLNHFSASAVKSDVIAFYNDVLADFQKR